MKSLLVLFVLSLCVFPALSQEGPDIFEIEGVTAPATYVNGIYERSATLIAGCPCYDLKGDLGLIYKNSNTWRMQTNRNCGDPIPGASQSASLFNTLGCDITEGPSDVRSFFNGASLIDLTPPAPIPTMSQWTLMILGLMLTSLAVVRIRKVAVA